jgi:hypothetical protein
MHFKPHRELHFCYTYHSHHFFLTHPVYGGKIDEKVNRFITIVNSLVQNFFPESTVRRHSKDKPFITNQIKSLIVERNTVYSSGKIELFRLLRACTSLKRD